ncbi:hypothetical protein DUI87_13634 [Hirundo rustica rustica]|uniref:ribonuclease H n=1 Tax=Hirundo rustica rustica TaxID=333673 RepID=A0A3M0KRU2_HIRRU|nr:hypothetical protein DUI87_13634 [Hirundo rustica rustica]
MDIPPFTVTLKNPDIPVRIRQYPISLEGRMGLKPEIDRLVSKGLLESCMSPFNTPILPVKKPDGTYRLVHDLREINKRTVARFPVVANPYTLLSNLGPNNCWYSVIDLKDAFWACPLAESSRDYFAFEWEDPETYRRQQLRWTVLPQGFTESPNLFGQALEQILQDYKTRPGVTLVQYVDDLLLAGERKGDVRKESIKLQNFLGLKGLKVSKAKLQFVEEEVKYLGHYLSKGEKRIDPERVKVTSLLEKVQRLLNVKDTTFLVFHLVTFLYMVYSFSRMSHTLLNTVGQQIEAREQGDKSVTQAAANPTAIQAAAKPDSEAKTPAVAAVKKGKKHTDKTDRPVDDDSGEGSSMPPDTQSGVKPPDTQSEAEATDDTQSEAEPTDTKSEAKSTGTRSGVQPTSTRSGAQPACYNIRSPTNCCKSRSPTNCCKSRRYY